MKYSRFHIIALVLMSVLSLMSPVLSARQISFSGLNTDNGLSHMIVNDIYIDEFGMVWIATDYGLNRFDGYSVQKFFNDKHDPGSMPDSKVKKITGDRKGHIWLLCQQSVAELDLNTMKFRLLHDDGRATCIYYNEDNESLYAGINRKVERWDNEAGMFVTESELLVPSNITSMIFSGDDLYVATMAKGVWHVDMTSNAHECILSSVKGLNFYKDSHGHIWVGSHQSGLYRIEQDGTVTVFRHDRQNPDSIMSDFVRCCVEDDMGKLWIGTDIGLSCYDPRTGRFENYNDANQYFSRVKHASIWCCRKDGQGNIWIGTYYGGVNYFNPQYEPYTVYSRSHIRKKSLSDNVIGCMVEDNEGYLWIATEGGGINRLDRKTGYIKWYTRSGTDLSSDNIQSLYYDGDKEILWIGTHLHDLNRLDIRTGKIVSYDDAQATPQAKTIKDILPYNDKLFLATHEGIFIFDTLTGQREAMQWNDELRKLIKGVSDIYIDSKNNLWLTVDNVGVLCHGLETGKDTMFVPSGKGSLSGRNITSIIEDNKGRMWFATSGYGVDMYDPQTGKFTNFDTYNSSIISNRTYTFAHSVSSDNIFFSTSGGVCSMDPSTGKCINYDKATGLPVRDINDNSLYVTRDSTVFLGSIHGLISFKEGVQSHIIQPYSITLSELTVDGKTVCPGDQTGILDRSISTTRSLTLKSDVSMFTIEFAVSNYLSVNKSDIQYRLEGFSDEWNIVHGQNDITYSKLPPGRYRLVIRPVSHDESICPPTTILIKVLPPWYLTWYSTLIWIILFFALVYVVMRIYLNSAFLKRTVEYEKQKIQDVEELNQAKLRFFSNISHEIRTPLTVIISQVESLIQHKEFTPNIYNKILSIYQNSAQLRSLITELLEFRKQEQGNLMISVAPHDIVKQAMEFYLVFEEFAISRHITFEMIKDVDELEVWYDQTQIQKVFRNLISNALKYTEEGGEVALYIGRTDEDMVLKVTDTGCGISESEIDKIFTNFYRVSRFESRGQEGTGIGLALAKGIVEQHHGTISVTSKEGKGTTFTVTLPLGFAHFTQDQLSTDLVETDIQVAEPSEDSHVKRKDKTMLIIDDNGSIRSLLADIFNPFYNILLASDGELGWEVVRKELPDIVVSDVVMPKLHGTELCRRIKAEPSTCHIPVVLLTARMDVEQNIEGMIIGADDYIAKPFNTKFLISRCNNLVNSRIILQEKFSRSPDMQSKMLATNAIDQNLIDRATAIIESNMANVEFNINDFAHEMAMSRTNLFKKIKAITGQTPNDFILTLRLKKGAFLLKNNPELSIIDIADQTGFASAKYFSKCFNDMYKMRPSAYRSM